MLGGASWFCEEHVGAFGSWDMASHVLEVSRLHCTKLHAQGVVNDSRGRGTAHSLGT